MSGCTQEQINSSSYMIITILALLLAYPRHFLPIDVPNMVPNMLPLDVTQLSRSGTRRLASRQIHCKPSLPVQTHSHGYIFQCYTTCAAKVRNGIEASASSRGYVGWFTPPIKQHTLRPALRKSTRGSCQQKSEQKPDSVRGRRPMSWTPPSWRGWLDLISKGTG